MSAKERDRLKIIAELAGPSAKTTRLTQARAAHLLRCTQRHVRRLVQRYRRQGDAGLVHRSRGKPSNRRFSDEFREQVMALVRKHYHDFGPTLAAEKLQERDGLTISRETLRRWMVAEDLWKPRARKATHRQCRERKACTGELVQIDTSEHDWFEGRGEQAVLVGLIDDATSRVFMRFFESDTTAANMAILHDYIARYGRPMAFYGDKAGHFVASRGATIDEQLEGIGPETQIGRALRELDIEWITAHSPQAKGRVERSFHTAQDRLIKEMRLAGIGTIEAANEFLEQHYLPYCRDRLACEPACDTDAHRPAHGVDLDAIFSRQDTRVVMNDYTIQFDNERYQIAKQSAAPGLVGDRVIVERRLDGSLRLRWRESYLKFDKAMPRQPQADAAALPLGLRPRSRTAAKGTGTTPKPDHPWRKNLKGAFRSQRQ